MRIKPFYHIKEAFINLWKNRTNSAGSIFIMSFTFAILGVVFIIVMNVNSMVKEAQTSFDEIGIFLQDGIDEEVVQALFVDLKDIVGVKNVRYEDKEEAFRRWKEEDFKDDLEIFEGIGNSPLPNAFYLTLNDISYTQTVADIISQYEGIEEVKYYMEEVDVMLTVSKVVAQIGLGVIAVLLILSFFVVSNTIKIAVNARYVEINIMKYIGAKNSFIRWPFIIEGILIGFISSAFSSGIVYSLYKYVIWSFGFDKVTMMDGNVFFSAVEPTMLMNTFIFISLILGIGIGILGSIRSTRKHLKV